MSLRIIILSHQRDVFVFLSYLLLFCYCCRHDDCIHWHVLLVFYFYGIHLRAPRTESYLFGNCLGSINNVRQSTAQILIFGWQLLPDTHPIKFQRKRICLPIARYVLVRSWISMRMYSVCDWAWVWDTIFQCQNAVPAVAINKPWHSFKNTASHRINQYTVEFSGDKIKRKNVITNFSLRDFLGMFRELNCRLWNSLFIFHYGVIPKFAFQSQLIFGLPQGGTVQTANVPNAQLGQQPQFGQSMQHPSQQQPLLLLPLQPAWPNGQMPGEPIHQTGLLGGIPIVGNFISNLLNPILGILGLGGGPQRLMWIHYFILMINEHKRCVGTK